MTKSNGDSAVKLPFYARATLILVGLFIFVHMLSLGRAIIVPLLFACVLSILLSSAVDDEPEDSEVRLLNHPLHLFNGRNDQDVWSIPLPALQYSLLPAQHL